MAAAKRKSLPLSDRVQVIHLSERGTSARKIAQQFGVGKTQIQSILLNKQAILQDFKDGAPAEKRNLRPTGNKKINKLTYEWFKAARSKNIPLSGPLLQGEPCCSQQNWTTLVSRLPTVGWKLLSSDMASNFTSYQASLQMLMKV